MSHPPAPRAHQPPLLDVQQLTYTYGDGAQHPVISDLTLRLTAGSFTCIVGPSGCGKSTLLHLIAGYLPPPAGSITLAGRDAHAPGPDRVLLTQDPVLFPWLRVEDNVRFALGCLDLSAGARDARVAHALATVRLDTHARDFPYQLSRGMQQRLALARALALRPSILLLDEPFASVDAQLRRHLQNVLLELWRETQSTILFVTHGVGEALRLADTIYLVSSQPMHVLRTYALPQPRPRAKDDPALLAVEREIHALYTATFTDPPPTPTP